jgi:chorismate mutase
MSESDENLSALPEVVRNANRPIVIYQVAPGYNLDVPTSNALGLISWLALLTVCVGAIVFSVWQVWNPGHDPRQFSPIYAEGRPLGLAGQIEERRQINQRADGLVGFLDRLRADRVITGRSAATHPLISDRDGIDDLRARWDTACRNIRARIYDRRLAQIDLRLSDLRAQRLRAGDSFARAKIDGDLKTMQQQRSDQVSRRLNDSDPALRCIPAAQAPVCEDANAAAWCNPKLSAPREFVDEVT